MIGSLALTCFTAGCPDLGGTGGEALVDGNQDPTLTSPLGKTVGEPNDSFDEPIVAVFQNGLARLQGTVSNRGDLDVFLIGALAAGERLTIDVQTRGSVLDASVAVFDDLGRLVVTSDDRDGTNTERFLDPFIDFITRHEGSSYSLVISHSAFSMRDRRIGSYTMDVAVRPGTAVPPPRAQVLVLNFGGGVVDSPVLGFMTLDPFDAADISRIYEGQTDLIRQTIRDVIEQNYSRFEVTVIFNDEPLPNEMPVSTIHFGGLDPNAFGLSENVDLYNADLCDDAIIFTNTFSPGLFRVPPTAEEMAVAVGNVASHEAGHLLGLNHVSNDFDLMDDRSAADAFLFDQEFMTSDLSADIMPIGTQDGVLLLAETVGLADGTIVP